MDNKSYSKGISWIDDCRIPFVDDGDKNSSVPGGKVSYTNESWGQQAGLEKDLQPKREPNTQGRFPANLLVSDDMLNDGKIYESGKGKPHHKRNKTLGEYQGNAYGKYNNVNPQINFENYYGDKGTNSRYYDIDKWFDKMINE